MCIYKENTPNCTCIRMLLNVFSYGKGVAAIALFSTIDNKCIWNSNVWWKWIKKLKLFLTLCFYHCLLLVTPNMVALQRRHNCWSFHYMCFINLWVSPFWTFWVCQQAPFFCMYDASIVMAVHLIAQSAYYQITSPYCRCIKQIQFLQVWSNILTFSSHSSLLCQGSSQYVLEYVVQSIRLQLSYNRVRFVCYVIFNVLFELSS